MEKYMPKETGYAALGFIPPQPSQPIPPEPLSKWYPFPPQGRKLTREEEILFREHYERTLWEHGLDPTEERNVKLFEYFARVKHANWDQVLERFKIILDCAIRGLPLPIFVEPEMEFKEIPREPVIHVAVLDMRRPVDEQAKTLEELAMRVKKETIDLVPRDKRKIIEELKAEDVKKILEEEYAKREKCHPKFKPLLEEKNYLWNILRPKDLEEYVKWRVFTRIPEARSLRDIVEATKIAFKLRVTEDDVRKWIEEELKKPFEEMHPMVKTYMKKCKEMLK
jgi:hypothetical protein